MKDLNNYLSQKGIFFTDKDLLINTSTLTPFLPIAATITQLNLNILNWHFFENDVIGIYCESPLEKMLKVQGFEMCPIRSCLAKAHSREQQHILKAYQWLNWDKISQFCGTCGEKLISSFDAIQKECQACKLILFPKMSPAVMVLIYRNDEILLARSHHFQPGVYSAIAGFVEIGESGELTAHREIKEELGIEISHLEYFATQAWPFPDSFMIAYKAKYLRGEICLDKNELEDAKWFNKHNLPTLPSKASISRKLIDGVLLTL